jgi:DNA-binding transcriptional ArsR family regulator
MVEAAPAASSGVRSMHPAATDPRILRAYAHPLRTKIIDRLETRVASPSDLATELDESIGTIAYHVRQLARANVISLVARRARRGTFEHYYTADQAPTLSDAEWSTLPTLTRRLIMASALRRIGPELHSAAKLGGFDRQGSELSVITGRMDGRTWRGAGISLRKALLKIERLSQETKARVADGQRLEIVPATAVMMLFKSPPRDGASVHGIRAGAIDFMDSRVLKANAHPLRMNILHLLSRRAASASDVARELDASLRSASYHLDRLAALGLIGVADTREKRGTFEPRYAVRLRPALLGDGWSELMDGVAVDQTIADLGSAVFAAARQGGFDADDIHYTRTALALDREGWNIVAHELRELERQLRRMARRPHVLPAKTEVAGSERIGAAVIVYQRQDAPMVVPATNPAPSPPPTGFPSGPGA